MDTVSTLPELPDTNLGDKSTRLSGGKPRQETAYVNTIWGSVWSGLVQDHDPKVRISCNAFTLTYHTHAHLSCQHNLALAYSQVRLRHIAFSVFEMRLQPPFSSSSSSLQ